MKFNLKNRPKFDAIILPENANEILGRYNNWLAEFEKELRERLETYDKISSHTADAKYALIKEILGE